MPVITQPMMIAPGDAPRDMSLGRLKTPPPIIEPTTRAISGTSVSLPVAGRTSPTVTSAAAVAMTPAPRWFPFSGRVIDLGQLLNRLERVSHSANLVRIVRRRSPIWRSGRLRSRDRRCTTTRQPRTRRPRGTEHIKFARLFPLLIVDPAHRQPTAAGRQLEAVAAVIRAEGFIVDHAATAGRLSRDWCEGLDPVLHLRRARVRPAIHPAASAGTGSGFAMPLLTKAAATIAATGLSRLRKANGR